MKIGLFTDPHYSSAELTCGKRFNSASLAKMKDAYRFFEEQACDLVVALGDMTDTEASHEREVKNLQEIAGIFSGATMETICLMGNHDAFVFYTDEFYDIVGAACVPRTIQNGRSNLLFIDACYLGSGEHYRPGHSDWTDTCYPHTQQLEETLLLLQGDVYVFMHQNIDPMIREDHRLSNDQEIRRILEASGKVKSVYQGHYHPGHRTESNPIQYITLPAMCENENAFAVIQIP